MTGMAQVGWTMVHPPHQFFFSFAFSLALKQNVVSCNKNACQFWKSYNINNMFYCAGVGLVQRCVIIQKDEKGYGLTVSGDNPVYVASVKPGNIL